MKRVWLAIATVVLLGLPARAATHSHVRVILDTSGSMAHTDPSRLARLATVLLYDLVHPNLSTGDTFQVLAFARSTAAWTSGPPPEANGPRVTPEREGRQSFANRVHDLQYNADRTYYYPMLQAAISDLEHAGAEQDRRVIVFVTDGQPEDPDVSLISRELIPRMERAGIQLYILAFGNQADAHRDSIQAALGGSRDAQLIVDPDGRGLLESMIQIFSRSFGYSVSNPTEARASSQIDLEDNQAPNQAAVVVYWKKREAPGFSLRTPRGDAVNSPEGVQSSIEDGASYSILWTLSPGRGMHPFHSDADGAQVVVLRPANYVVTVEQVAGFEPHETMATTALPLKVIVAPPGGVRDFQGPVTLSFQTNGPRSDKGYEWTSDLAAPPGNGTPNGRGVAFDIFPTFLENRADKQKTYEGFLTVEVRRNGVVVGSLAGDHAHQVSVYPFLQLTAMPGEEYAKLEGEPALRSSEVGCANFQFNLAGELPFVDRGTYAVRAVLPAELAAQPQLNRAEFRLDGDLLEFEGSQSQRHGEWFSGKRLTAKQLLAPHSACIVVGKPKQVESGTPLSLPVRFTLIESPYDRPGVIGPFSLKVMFAPATTVERYGSAIALVLGALVALAALWALRYRPVVPARLVFAVARDGAEPVRTALGPRPLLRRLLGLTEERTASAEDGSLTLGTIRPVDEELYRFRGMPGMGVSNPDGTSPVAAQGAYLLSVNRDYIVQAAGQRYRFRLRFS
jgi:hypothetical protein